MYGKTLFIIAKFLCIKNEEDYPAILKREVPSRGCFTNVIQLTHAADTPVHNNRNSFYHIRKK